MISVYCSIIKKMPKQKQNCQLDNDSYKCQDIEWKLFKRVGDCELV